MSRSTRPVFVDPRAVALFLALPAGLAGARSAQAQEPPMVTSEEGREVDVWVIEDHGATDSCERMVVTLAASDAPELRQDGPIELRTIPAGETTRVCITGSTRISRATDDVAGADQTIDASAIELGSRVRMRIDNYRFQTNPPRVRAIEIVIPG